MFDSTNNRTSILVSSQLPAFVRDDHENFVKFVENYYKFLEQDGQLLYVTKNFTRFLDPDIIANDIMLDSEAGESHGGREDESYHIFLQKLWDNFLGMVPDTVKSDKTLILKHAKDFYRSCGSEKSVRFLMRILFNKEVDIYYPKRDILKASDGKWFVERSIKIRDTAVDNVSNSKAVINFAGKYIRGAESNAFATVEKVETFTEKGVVVTEMKLSGILRDFKDGETIYTFFEEEGTQQLKYLTSNTYGGTITSITLVNGGTGYVEGTEIPVIANNDNGSGASIIISAVTRGTLGSLFVTYGGGGYRLDDPVSIFGGGGLGASATVTGVSDDNQVHPNTYTIMSSLINVVSDTTIDNVSYSNLNTIYTVSANLTVNVGNGAILNVINLSDNVTNSNVYFETGDYLYIIETNTTHLIVGSNTYYLANSESNTYYSELNVSPGLAGDQSNLSFDIIKKPNSNNSIADSMYYWRFSNTGPVTSVTINTEGSGYQVFPKCNVVANTLMTSLGILGSMKVVASGINYRVGNKIRFTNQPGSYGYGALGNVTAVSSIGQIQTVSFDTVPGFLPGGSGYDQSSLPTAEVETLTGYGADIQVTGILGAGDILTPVSETLGRILRISIASGGKGYLTPPTLDFANVAGNGACAVCNVVTGVITYPGRYLNDDGKLSAYNFIQDRDYYQNYSYVVRVDESLSNYRKPIMDLVHPAGTKLFGEYLYEDENLKTLGSVSVLSNIITITNT